MKSFGTFLFILSAASHILPEATAFSFLVDKTRRNGRPSFLAMVEEGGGGDNGEPVSYFQMQQLPVATTTSKLDRFVECAEESGECDVTEMQEMIEELERLNLECQGEHSLECNLDTVAARNILKVALASQVAIQGAVECSSDPFMEMHEMDDQCMDPMHRVPTATGEGLQHIIDCADGNEQCDVTDMIEMMEELERLNLECEGTLSRECNLEAVEARNILKVALASQVAIQDVRIRK